MSELPNGWVTTVLGDIATLRGTKISPTQTPDAPFIGLEDIEPNTSKILKVGKGSDVKSAVATFIKGDVLYSRLRPYLNKVTVPDFDGIASAEILVLEPSSAAEAEFIRRRIMTADFLDFTALLDKGDRPRVNYPEIAGFPIDLPPLAEQRKIVAKLDSLTGRSARARVDLGRIPLLTARFKQAVLEAAFSGRLSDDAGSLTASKAGLPAGWSHQTLGALVDEGPSNGWSPPTSQNARGTLSLKLTATTSGELRLDDRAVKRINQSVPPDSKFWLEPGDLLIQRANALEHVGASAIYEGPRMTYIYPDLMMRIRIADPVLRRLIWRYLNSAAARRYFRDNATGTSGNMPKINGQTVRSLLLPIPPAHVRAELVRRIDYAFAEIGRLEGEARAANRLLNRLDQAILAKAFRGVLVPQDPNDEPASVLLERIGSKRTERPKKASARASKVVATTGVALGRAGASGKGVAAYGTSGANAVSKSRNDPNVKGKPYLTDLLNSMDGVARTDALYSRSDLELVDFYRQLSDEHDRGWLVDDNGRVRVA